MLRGREATDEWCDSAFIGGWYTILITSTKLKQALKNNFLSSLSVVELSNRYFKPLFLDVVLLN